MHSEETGRAPVSSFCGVLLNCRPMVWTLFLALFALWLIAHFAFHIASGLIHLLLLGAVVALVVGLVRRTT